MENIASGIYVEQYAMDINTLYSVVPYVSYAYMVYHCIMYQKNALDISLSDTCWRECLVSHVDLLARKKKDIFFQFLC